MNLDVVPVAPSVIRHDLESPLPLAAETCAAVYHSHVLEHLPREIVPAFLAECFRVLVPGGVIRVVVPDLETIARLYLRHLEDAALGDATSAKRHDWMTIELLDQLVRERSGGLMLEYWKQNPMPAEDYVYERLGWEAKRFVEEWRKKIRAASPPPRLTPEEVTRFRQSGEIHRWMYDRVSLAALLTAAGFIDPRVCTAGESRIAKFGAYGLDADGAGVVRKPDSLFFEALKPEALT